MKTLCITTKQTSQPYFSGTPPLEGFITSWHTFVI